MSVGRSVRYGRSWRMTLVDSCLSLGLKGLLVLGLVILAMAVMMVRILVAIDVGTLALKRWVVGVGRGRRNG